MKARLTLLALVLALTLGFSSRAHAGALTTDMLDFGIIAPTSGSISFAGGVAPLIGSGIDVNNIVGLPTGPILNCVGCFLNFTTGALTGSTPTTWTFGGVGSITVTGSAFDGATLVASGTLLSGSFGSVTVTAFSGGFKIAGASFTDVKDPRLLEFYGLPTAVPYNGNFNISFMGAGTPPGGFTSSMVLSGDIINHPVDLPSSLLLLGSGLVGFAYLTARSRRS